MVASASAFVLPLAVSIFFVLSCAILVLMLTVDYSFSAARSFAYSHAAVIAASGQAHLQRHLTNGAVRHFTGAFQGYVSGRHPNPTSVRADNTTHSDAIAQSMKDFYGYVSTFDPTYEVLFSPTVTYVDGTSLTCFSGPPPKDFSASEEDVVLQQTGYVYKEGDAVYCTLYDTRHSNSNASLGDGGAAPTSTSTSITLRPAFPRVTQRIFVRNIEVDVRETYSTSPYARNDVTTYAYVYKGGEGGVVAYDATPLGNFVFTSCPRTESTRPYFSDVYIHSERLEPSLGVCSPLYFRGTYFGVLHGAVHLDGLADTLNAMPRTLNSLLVLLDNRGLVVATSDRAKETFKTFSVPRRPDKIIPENCVWSRGILVCRYRAMELPEFSLLNRLARERPDMFSVAYANPNTTTTPNALSGDIVNTSEGIPKRRYFSGEQVSEVGSETTTATSTDPAKNFIQPEDYPVAPAKLGKETYYCASVLIDLSSSVGSPLRWRFVVAIPDNDVSSSIKKGRDIGFAVVAVVVVVAITICGVTLWILLKQSRDTRNKDNNLDADESEGEGNAGEEDENEVEGAPKARSLAKKSDNEIFAGISVMKRRTAESNSETRDKTSQPSRVRASKKQSKGASNNKNSDANTKNSNKNSNTHNKNNNNNNNDNSFFSKLIEGTSSVFNFSFGFGSKSAAGLAGASGVGGVTASSDSASKNRGSIRKEVFGDAFGSADDHVEPPSNDLLEVFPVSPATFENNAGHRNDYTDSQNNNINNRIGTGSVGSCGDRAASSTPSEYEYVEVEVTDEDTDGEERSGKMAAEQKENEFEHISNNNDHTDAFTVAEGIGRETQRHTTMSPDNVSPRDFAEGLSTTDNRAHGPIHKIISCPATAEAAKSPPSGSSPSLPSTSSANEISKKSFASPDMGGVAGGETKNPLVPPRNQ